MLESLSDFGLLGLLAASFLAATILPLSSEIVLSVLLLSGYSSTSIVAVATLGNVAGSLTGYALGRVAKWDWLEHWFGISSASLATSERRFNKYGLWTLCFTWLPVIGDPICVVAGVFRVSLIWFIILVTSTKCLRYSVLCYVIQRVVDNSA